MIYRKTQLTEDYIDVINKKAEDEGVYVECDNTKGLTSELLSRLHPNINIIVKGGLNKEKYMGEHAGNHYKNRVTYASLELRDIVEEFETIEASIPENLNQEEVAAHVYNHLTKSLKPDNDYKKKDGHESQSLKVILNGAGICAGFSLLYKELMERNNIKCEYVRGQAGNTKHARNVLIIDDKRIPVDLMWDITRVAQQKPLHYFGNVKDCAESLEPDPDDKPFHDFSQREKEEPYTVSQPKITTNELTRRDGTKFLMEYVGETIVKGKPIYQYAHAEIEKDGRLSKTSIIHSENDFNKLTPEYQDCFINALCTQDRILQRKYENNGYVGFVGTKDNKPNKFRDDRINVDNLSETATYTRLDGSHITVMKDKEQNWSKDIAYTLFEFQKSEQGYKLLRDKKVSTEKMTGKDINKEHADTLLSRKNINNAKNGKLDMSIIAKKTALHKAKKEAERQKVEYPPTK